MVPVEFARHVLVAFVGAGLVQLEAYSYALKRRRVDVVDVAWGLSFIGVIVALQIYRPAVGTSELLVSVLVVVWGTRLALHIYRRFVRSAKQDERYTALMQPWPQRFYKLQLLVRIFVVQALLATLISFPVIAVYTSQPAVGMLTYIGAAIWLLGFVVEVVADKQLAAFLRTAPSGALMQSGLWRYSRHPNYFGEVTMWWGLAVIACSTPYWWAGIIGASVITFLICFVSGVPPAERRTQRKPGWQAYRRKTSVLIPWPPRTP